MYMEVKLIELGRLLWLHGSNVSSNIGIFFQHPVSKTVQVCRTNILELGFCCSCSLSNGKSYTTKQLGFDFVKLLF